MSGFNFNTKHVVPLLTGSGRLGTGNIPLSTPLMMEIIPGLNEGDPRLLVILQNSSANCLVIIRESNNSFPINGTLNTNYWIRSRANLGLTSGSLDQSIIYIPGNTRENDLIAISQSGNTASGNIVNLVRRGNNLNNPFVSSGIDNVNVFSISNANLGGFVQMRQLAFAKGATLENDLLIVVFNGSNTQYLPRGNGSVPFPGSSTAGSLRRSITRANLIGSNSGMNGVCLVPHPVNASEDLLCFGNGASDSLWFVQRGSGLESTHFDGSIKFEVTNIKFGNATAPGRIFFGKNPANPSLDSVYLANNSNISRSLFRNGDTGSFSGGIEGTHFFSYSQQKLNLDVSFSMAMLNKPETLQDEILIANSGSNTISTAYAWRFDSQPSTESVDISFIAPSSPVFVNQESVTVDSSVSFFDFKRIIKSLAPIFEVPWSYETPTTETMELSTDLIFQGVNTEITGNYRIFSTNGSKVTLSRNIHNEPITIESTGILEISRDTQLGSNFILESGVSIQRSGVSNVTLEIPYPNPGLTISQGITLIQPIQQTVLTGIPQVEGAVIAVINLTTNDVTYPGISGGQAIFQGEEGVNYLFACDAPGYLRQVIILDGSTPSFTFNLPDYRDIYESGTSRPNEISFNYQTFEVIVKDDITAYSFADVFRTIEDYLSTEQGILFPFPPFPAVIQLSLTAKKNYLFFPYDTNNDQPNPVRIKPDPSNVIDPTLTDFVIVLQGANAPLFDIFDFSGANGRTIRFQTEANSIDGGNGGLTEDDRAVLAEILSKVSTLPENPAAQDLIEAQLTEIQSDIQEGAGTAEGLQLIADLLTADEDKGKTRHVLYKAGTNEVIYDKTVTFSEAEGFKKREP